MDEAVSTTTAVWTPSLGYRLQEMTCTVRRWFQRALFRMSLSLADESNSERHAKRELKAAGYDLDDKEEGPNKWVVQNLLDLLRVFSTQGHSGHSAPYCVQVFEKLALHKPLVPLTGADDEWMHHGDGMYQNLRCGAIFKQPDCFDGQAYFIDGRVFREPSGACYTNRESMVPIEFPYTPATVYVDVPE